MGILLGQVCGTLAGAATTSLTAAQRDLAQQCTFFADPNASATALGTGWVAILGEQLDALSPQVKTFAVAQDVTLGRRLAQLREGAQGDNLDALNRQGVSGLSGTTRLSDLLPLGAGAGSPTFFDGRLGLFVNGDIKNGSHAPTANSYAFDVKNSSVTAGADYRFTPWLVAGLSYAGGTTHFDYYPNLGYMDLRDNGLILYTSIYKGPIYLDLLAGYSRSTLHEERHLSYANTTAGTTIDQYAMGHSQQHNLWGGLSVGDEISWHSFFANPEGSLTWHQSHLDAYTEVMSDPTGGGSGLALSYGSAVMPSLHARLGLRVGVTLNTRWGVLQPQMHGSWTRELRTAPDNYSARFAAAEDLGGGADTPLTMQADPAQTHFFTTSGGLHATFTHGFSAFFDYETLDAVAGIKSHELSFGVRFQPGI
jgi:hypothetical protein